MNIWEPFLEITEDAMRRILDVDLVGTIYCAQAAGRAMVRRGQGGKIINISSVHAVMSFPTAAIYDAAKAGVARLTATIALELAEHHINVNAIGPGWIETPLSEPFLRDPAERQAVEATIPWRRVGQPQDIGRLAVFLASEDADYITGQLILCDGGFVLGK
jgi:glucose 1-dehydrogenase